MGTRKGWMWAVSGVALLSIVTASTTRVTVAKDEGKAAAGKIAAEVRKAERVLIVTPETDIDAAGGEQFLVEINEVLKGTGKKGTLVRVINSGDETRHPSYKAGRQYVFLLKKNADKKWVNATTAELPVEDGSVEYVVDGKSVEKISVEALEELAQSQPAEAADAGPVRESPAGRWFVVISEQGHDIYFWLIDITKGDGDDYKVKLIEASKNSGASMLKSSSISGNDVQLVFALDTLTFDFKGRFEKGAVRGSILVGDRGMALARLVPTDANSLRKFAEPQPLPEREAYGEAVSQDDSFEPVQKFIRRHPDSPLVLDAYRDLVSQVKKKRLDEEQVARLGSDYVRAAARWGSRNELRANLDLGMILSRFDLFPEAALGYLFAAESYYDKDTPPMWKSMVTTQRGKLLLSTGKEADGLALLKKVRGENPFDGEVTMLLARHAEKAGKVDDALALYGEIVALPMMERMAVTAVSTPDSRLDRDQFPSKVFARLWKEKHGSTKGMSEYLDEQYEKAIHSLASDKQPPRKAGDGTRVVLCELFTGAQCPPCVAADVATTALEGAYAKSEVIVLRYHQHIPAPDPLANDDSEERFSDYDGEGTPTLIINGKPFEGNPSGSMVQAPDLLKELRAAIDPYLTEKTDLKLDVSAKANGSKIAITAKAGGLKKFPDEVRLRLALAEDKIAFVAGNGIRVHDSIVRTMPGGADGIEPEKGELAFTGDVDLLKLKSQLTKYLAKAESNGAEFDEKPLDFKDLHLIAFLQNSDTNEILQAVAVPVAGKLSLEKEAEEPAAAPPEKKKAATSGKSGKK